MHQYRLQFDTFVSCVFYFMMYSTARTTQCWWHMNKIWEWSIGQTIMTQEGWRNQTTTHPSARLSTINPIQNTAWNQTQASLWRAGNWTGDPGTTTFIFYNTTDFKWKTNVFILAYLYWCVQWSRGKKITIWMKVHTPYCTFVSS